MFRNIILRKFTLPIILTVLVSQILYTGLVLASSPVGQLSSTPEATAEIVEEPSMATVIHLKAPGNAVTEANESRIEIRFTEPYTLNDLVNLSWRVNTTMGYPPHTDILLSEDGENVTDELVFEFAYQPYVGAGYEYVSPGNPYGHYDPGLQGFYYNPPYNGWVNTFQNATDEIGTGIIDNNSICWLGSGLPGPYNISGPAAFFGKLGDFKNGTVTAIGREDASGVSGNTTVIGINIEIDNWIGPSEAYISEVTLNGESTPPEITIISPASTYNGDVPLHIEVKDLFTYVTTTYNVTNSTGHPFYENEPYNGPTYLTGLNPGEYTLIVTAESMIGLKTIVSEEFNVTATGIEVKVTPVTLNLKSSGKWVNVKIKLPEGMNTNDFEVEDVCVSILGIELTPEWYQAGQESIVLKFNRTHVQELAEGSDTLDVTVTGTINGESFAETDTIRIINPGNKNQNKEAHQIQSQTGKDPKNKANNASNAKGPKPNKENNGKAKGRNK